MRGAALVSLFLGLVILGVAAAIRMFDDVMPFSASYAPRHDLLELTYFAAAPLILYAAVRSERRAVAALAG